MMINRRVAFPAPHALNSYSVQHLRFIPATQEVCVRGGERLNESTLTEHSQKHVFVRVTTVKCTSTLEAPSRTDRQKGDTFLLKKKKCDFKSLHVTKEDRWREKCVRWSAEEDSTSGQMWQMWCQDAFLMRLRLGASSTLTSVCSFFGQSISRLWNILNTNSQHWE